MPSSICSRLLILLLFVTLVLAGSLSHAQHLVLAFDVSQNMAKPCSEGNNTGFECAQKYALTLLNEKLATDPEIKISIISFAGNEVHTSAVSSGNRNELKSTIKNLTLKDHTTGSVSKSLQTATELLKKEEDLFSHKGKVVVFSAGKDVGEKGLLSILSEVRNEGVAVELLLFSGRKKISSDAAPLSRQQLEIAFFDCPSGDSLTPFEQKVFIDVRQQTAKYLGYEIADINLNTDIITDLAADTYVAYELLALLCNSYEVSLPDDRSMSSIEQITRYIAQVKKNKTRGEELPLHRSYEKIVYYATDRNRTNSSDPDDVFGPHRCATGELAYGTCIVSIPENHNTGKVERPLLGLKFLESTDEHIVLLEVNPLKKEELFAELRTASKGKSTDPTANDILIFIHGFNQSFVKAARRTAQIAVDLDYQGVPLMYSWPSNNSFFDYWEDREDVSWSIAHLERLLSEIGENVPDMGLNLIAHSMGNQALIGALNRISLQAGSREKPLFKNIILAAPDFDARLFQEQIAPSVVGLAANWSIYTSENDKALTYSSDINDAKRLGLPLPYIKGMDIIDATNVEVTPWNVPEFHSYYATKQVVINDMTDNLKGISPSVRGLIPLAGTPSLWLIKLPKKIKQVIHNPSSWEDRDEQ